MITKYLEKVSYQLQFSQKYEAVKNLVLNILDKIAPTKQRYIRGNQSPFMNKDILKALMNGTRFRNSTPMNRLAYKKQRNYCVSVMRENQNNIILL